MTPPLTKAKPSAVFVDDDECVLSGLRRILHPLSSKWDFVFTTSSAEALRTLESGRVDVIVTDMRMPGFGGAELLKEVRSRFPDTVRLVLSGHADRDDIVRAVGPIHQFLQKPCAPEAILRVLQRVLHLRQMLQLPNVRACVAGLESLPTLPESYRRLMAELDRPNANAKSIGDIVAKDVAMTAKLLQLVNSAFFGSTRTLRTSHEAVGRLGLNTVRTLVVGLRVFDQFKEPSVQGFSLTGLWQRGLVASKRCGEIARERGAKPAEFESAALAGLLHEVGRLALASGASERLTEAIALAKKRDIALALAEHEVIGVAQGPVGSYLLGLWGFADDVVEAVGLFEHLCDAGTDTTPLSILRAATSSPEVERLWRVPEAWPSEGGEVQRSVAA